MNTGFLDPAVATVPTACGIETSKEISLKQQFYDVVATVPTACGIETDEINTVNGQAIILFSCNSTYRLRY